MAHTSPIYQDIDNNNNKLEECLISIIVILLLLFDGFQQIACVRLSQIDNHVKLLRSVACVLFDANWALEVTTNVC